MQKIGLMIQKVSRKDFERLRPVMEIPTHTAVYEPGGKFWYEHGRIMIGDFDINLFTDEILILRERKERREKNHV